MTDTAVSSGTVKSNHSTVKAFSPVGDLLRQSWETVKLSWKNILLIYLALYAVFFVGILIIGGTWAGSFAISAGTGVHLAGASAFAVVITVVVALALAVVATSFGTALILAVAQAEEKPGMGSLVSRGFKLFLPVFLTSLLMAFLIYGGSILFLIGGIVIAIFTCFSTYEVIFTENKYSAAISNSVRMVAQNFGEIFIRFLVLVGIAIGLWIVDATLINMVGDNGAARGLMGLVKIVVDALFGWFTIAYAYLLYKEAREATDFKRPASTAWVWWVAIIGWIVGILVVIFAFSFIKSVLNSAALKKELMQGKMDSKQEMMLNGSDSEQFNVDQYLEQNGANMTDDEKAQFKQMMENAQSAMDEDQKAAQQEKTQ